MDQAPEWWENLTPEGRETYIRTHPRSAMAKFLNQEARDRISANKEERAKLRSKIKKIGSDPKKVLKSDFEKFDKVKPGRFTKKKEEQLDAALKQSKRGKIGSIAKAVGIALAVAGVATIGGAVLAGGGLPYVIITHRLIKDVGELGKVIHEKIKSGQPQLQAVLSSVKETISKTMTDPKVIAASLILSQNRKEKEAQKVNSPTKGEKKAVKTQGVVEKKPKKHNSDAITELAPKKKVRK